MLGDVNGDGAVNNSDLQSLLDQIKAGGGSAAVPEPMSYVQLSIGLLIALVSDRLCKMARAAPEVEKRMDCPQYGERLEGGFLRLRRG